MARKRRWTLPFKSLNGTDCVIDIYEEGYTGNTVTTLTGAAQPFIYEEDNATDLLKFVRVKTARLCVIEDTYGELDALHPDSPTHHYVVATYGSEVVFTGYMECAEYSGEWVACPREIEFPIISPLGLLESYTFATRAPQLTTLGTLMKEVLTTINPYVSGDATQQGYQWVMYPGASGSSGTVSPWDGKIRSIAICPMNDSFQHYDTANDLYVPKNFQEFVEGLCGSLQWTVHDTPQGVVFVKYDDINAFSRLDVSDLDNPSTATRVIQQNYALSSYFENADNNATASVVPPLRSLTINVDGESIGPQAVNARYAIGSNLGLATDVGQYCKIYCMQNVDPTLTSPLMRSSGSWPGADAGLYPMAIAQYDQDSVSLGFTDGYGFVYKSNMSSGYYKEIFTKTFPLVPNVYDDVLLKIQMEKGTSPADKKSNWGTDNMSVYLLIERAGLYYKFGTGWIPSAEYNSVSIDKSTGKFVPNGTLGFQYNADKDGILFPAMRSGLTGLEPLTITIAVSVTSGLSDNDFLFIKDFSLNDPDQAYKSYQKSYLYKEKYVLKGNGYTDNSYSVGLNNFITSINANSFTPQRVDVTGFTYLFNPLRILDQRVTRKASYSVGNTNDYNVRFTGWQGGQCRIISKSFYMRDDEYKIITAQSPIFNS